MLKESPGAALAKTALPAGPETGAVPFPHQKAIKGRFLRLKLGGTTKRFRALVPIEGDESAFFAPPHVEKRVKMKGNDRS